MFDLRGNQRLRLHLARGLDDLIRVRTGNAPGLAVLLGTDAPGRVREALRGPHPNPPLDLLIEVRICRDHPAAPGSTR